MRRDVYLGFLKLDGEENEDTLTEPTTTRHPFADLQRFEEAKTHCCAKRCPWRDAFLERIMT